MSRNLARRINRRKLLGLTLAGTAAVLVGGKAARSTKAAAKVSELSMILFDNYWTPSLREMFKRYRDETGVQITWDNPPLGGFYQRQLSLMLAREKKPDIISHNDTILSQYAGSGLLEPLDDFLKDPRLTGPDYRWDEFPEQMRRAASWSKDFGKPGKIYGLPFELATWGYFYRADLIDEPPATFTEYIEVAKKFTKSINPNSPTQYGAVIDAKQLPPQYKEWYAWLWAYGGDIFDQKLRPTMNSPRAVKSLEDDYGLLLKLKATPPDTATYSVSEKTAAFQNGLVPHLLHWTNQYPIYVDAQKSPKLAGRVKYTMVPGMPGGDGRVRRFPYTQQWMFALNPNGEHKEEAFKFIAWLTSPKGMAAWAQAGYPGASRASVLKNEALQKKNPAFPVTLEAVKIGRYAPSYVKEYAQIADSMLTPALSQVLAGSRSAKGALDSVNRDATKILKSAGYLKS